MSGPPRRVELGLGDRSDGAAGGKVEISGSATPSSTSR